MISPRLNFSLIKAKFRELAPAINKRARLRQRHTYLIRLVSKRLRPCWFGKLIPEVSSPHMVSISSLSAELVRFWNGPLLQAQPGPDQEPWNTHVHSSNFPRGDKWGLVITGTKRINVLIVKLRQISAFARNKKETRKQTKGSASSRFSSLKFSRIQQRRESGSHLRSLTNIPGECESSRSLLIRASTSHPSVQLPPHTVEEPPANIGKVASAS